MRAGHLAVVCLLLMTAGCAARRAAEAPLCAHVVEVERGAGNLLVAAELKFATYNVHGLDRPEDIRADLARLGDVGVWALQEVVLDTAENHAPALREILPSGRWHIAALPVNLIGKRRVESQIIVSRWPIVNVEIWKLDSESAKRRVALAATLDTPQGRVLFVNADLEPSPFGFRHGSRLGAQSLARHLADHRAGKVIVTGDFNTTGNLWRFAGDGGDAAALCEIMRSAQCERVNQTTATFRAGWLNLSLDHVFTRGVKSSAWAVDHRATGSDHYPLWCRIEPAMEVASNVSDESERRPAIDGATLRGGRLGGGLDGAAESR